MRKNKSASHSSEKPVLGARNRGILEPFAGGNSAFVGNAVFFAESKALSSCVKRICFAPSQKAIFV